MGNSTSFRQIQKKYGQDAIDYIAFRYHQRRNYHKIRDHINRLKEHAHVQKQQVLEFIDKQKRLLQEEFNRAKRQAEAYEPDCIKKTQALSKQPVEEFSGYNQEIIRLENLRLDANTKYQSEKTSMEKRIRYQTTKEQNKSNLKGIKQFDEKSDSQRKNIENQCISLNPQKANQQHLHDFDTKYNWENQKKAFDLIFDKEKEEKEGKSIRSRIRDNVIPSKNPVCC